MCCSSTISQFNAEFYFCLNDTLSQQEMSPRLMESGNGLIELGLCFSPISSQLKIQILSAEKLKAVNLVATS